jgi:hypothetical protein
VRRVVFLSSGAVDAGTERQPDVIAQYRRDVERAIESSGTEWTFLRLLFPAINSLTFAMQLQGSDVVRVPYTEAAFSVVHERDVAEVAVRVLTGGGHAGRSYDLTGPESLTQAQQICILGETLGRTLTVEDLDPELVRTQMSQFMDPEFVAALFGLMAAAVGKPAPVNDLIEQITGHPAHLRPVDRRSQGRLRRLTDQGRGQNPPIPAPDNRKSGPDDGQGVSDVADWPFLAAVCRRTRRGRGRRRPTSGVRGARRRPRPLNNHLIRTERRVTV